MHPRVVAIMRKWGFHWGGAWPCNDPMRLELGAIVTAQ